MPASLYFGRVRVRPGMRPRCRKGRLLICSRRCGGINASYALHVIDSLHGFLSRRCGEGFRPKRPVSEGWSLVDGVPNALSDLVGRADEQSNRLFSEMVDAIPVAIYATDPEGRLKYFNAAAVSLSGRVPELGTDQWCITWKLFLPDGTPLPHDQCPMAIALKGGVSPARITAFSDSSGAHAPIIIKKPYRL